MKTDRIHALLALIAIIALALFSTGCATQPAGHATVPTQDTDAPADEQPAPAVSDVIAAETKTADEQHQETLAAAIADGVYADDVTYAYHSGEETVTISVTVENNVVIAASVVGHDPHPASAKYIGGVHAALPDLVVGKRLDEIELPRQISGSSLTTAAVAHYLERVAAGEIAAGE